MRLTVVGSGDAFNSSGRAHSCYLVEGEGVKTMMVDFGATALSALRRAGRSPGEVEHFVLTHLHGDHVGGFPFLLIDAMFHELRFSPLDVVGPVGTRAKLLELFRASYGPVADMPRPFELQVTELLPGQRLERGGAIIHCYAAEHMDLPDRPLCLRIEAAASGRAVAFSGDTEICDGLFAASQGAELLVAECTALAPPAGRHITWEDWRQSFHRVGSRRLLLSHLSDAVRERIPELLRGAPGGLELAFAEDGLVVLT